MTPIVNGLKQDYGKLVDFQLLDASSGEGAALFEHYGLLGHPGYVLLDSTGVEQWRGLGPVTESLLEDRVRIVVQE